MKILIDCDVLLDVGLGRQPHYEASAKLLDWAEQHPAKAAVAWHSIANLFYLMEGKTTNFIEDLTQFVTIPATGDAALSFALSLGFKDFEDAMQVAAADSHFAQAIVTRNLRHYRKSPIKALAPDEFLALAENYRC